MHNSLLDFDPYETLLGIKVSQRPLNPYQLLNLAGLDANRDRVRLALDRQKAILENKRRSADADVWQTLHDELDAAAATLLDPEQRAVVDAAIKRKLAVSQPRPSGQSSHGGSSSATLVCSGCQHENSASRRFCTQCGHGLWATCPQCRGEIAAQERYCGNCGTDVRALLEEQVRQLQERLDSAAALVKEHRYDGALSALRSVAAVPDPKFEPWVTRALAEIEVVDAQRQRALADAQAAKAEAQRLIQNKAFSWAVAVLEKVPLPLRDAEATELLAQSQFAGKELAELVAEIRTAAQEGNIGALFPKIDRVLILKPDHQPILKLADQLRQKFVTVARQRLAERRYADGVQALLQIPPSLHTDEVRELLDVASELSALFADLRESPFATPDVLALAQRLARHVTGSEEIAALVQQLAERCVSPPSHPWQARPGWSQPRERSGVGPPVEWLGNFVRAQAATSQVTQSLRDHPGEFFVALGLALQGIGEAAIEISLMPPERGHMLGKFAAIPLLARKPSSAWGIDLGSCAVKAVKLVKEAGGKLKVQEAHYIPLRKSLTHPEAEGQQRGILAEALSDLAGRADLKGSHVAAGMAGHQVLGRFFDLPPLPSKKLASAVEYEARHQIPIELAELCWDWTELGSQDPKQAGATPQPVVVVAVRRSHAEDRLALFEAAGIRLDSLQSHALALHNALRFEVRDQAAPLAILDVGADESNFIVSSPRSVWFRSFALAGHSATMALVQEFRLDYEAAEELKRHPAKARRYHQFRKALQPLFAQFADEIDRSLASFRRQSAADAVGRLLVLGGGTNLHGLLRHLIAPSAD